MCILNRIRVAFLVPKDRRTMAPDTQKSTHPLLSFDTESGPAGVNAASAKPTRRVDFRRVVVTYAKNRLCRRRNLPAQISSARPFGPSRHRFCRKWQESLQTDRTRTLGTDRQRRETTARSAQLDPLSRFCDMAERFTCERLLAGCLRDIADGNHSDKPLLTIENQHAFLLDDHFNVWVRRYSADLGSNAIRKNLIADAPVFKQSLTYFDK